tara:strand:- start:743 stop:1759 length:1017 start_codon:yes stop_codon:yes gene_type:complete
MILPLVSVVITTYKRYELAQKAINDVLNQTYENIELIIIEDGSNSGIEYWIKQFQRNKIKYYRNEERLGLSKSRNKGIQLSQGDYIAFMDDDCRWLKTKISLQMNIIRKSKHIKIMIYCGTCKEENGKILPDVIPTEKGLMKKYIFKGSLLPQSSMLIPKQPLLSIGSHSEEFVSCIDHDIWFKLAKNGFYMDLSPHCLVYSLKHNSPRMINNLDQRLEGIQQFIQKWKFTVIDEYDERAWNTINRKYYIQTVLTIIEELYNGNIQKNKANVYFQNLYHILGLKYNFIDKLALDISNESFTSPIYYTPIRKRYPILLKNLFSRSLRLLKNIKRTSKLI